MAALRLMIDEHEKSTLQQIAALRTEESSRLKDYKAELKWQSIQCDQQKDKLAKLTTDGIDLMQSEAAFKVSMQEITRALEEMQIPRRNYHHIQGIDQMEMVREQITQCGRYVKYSNLKLEQRIAVSDGQSKLELEDVRLTVADMGIVAHAVQSNQVSNSASGRTTALSRVASPDLT